jgi:hypothetical protein
MANVLLRGAIIGISAGIVVGTISGILGSGYFGIWSFLYSSYNRNDPTVIREFVAYGARHGLVFGAIVGGVIGILLPIILTAIGSTVTSRNIAVIVGALIGAHSALLLGNRVYYNWRRHSAGCKIETLTVLMGGIFGMLNGAIAGNLVSPILDSVFTILK